VAIDPLDYLVSWYAAHCDGDWEHDSSITIGTLDNPGWRLFVNQVRTELEGRSFDRGLQARSENDWVDIRSDGRIFEAHGGPSNLHELLVAFRDFAEGNSAGR
jgi:hypothetical protein